MKTKRLYRPDLSDQVKRSLFQKMLMMAFSIVLIAAFLPVPSVLAAPASAAGGDTLGQEWNNKLSMVRDHNLFYAQAKLFPADFESSEAMARPYDLLHKYGFALKQANDIILKHAGFDEEGEVVDEELAVQSVHGLGDQLHAMRGFLEKIDEEGYELHRIK